MSSKQVEQYELKMSQTRLLAEDLPSDRFLRFYSFFQHYACLMATISFFGTAFVIVKASTKQMKTYKWFLLHEIIWSYIFDICICLSLMIPLLPHHCVYSIGMMRNTSPYAMQNFIKFTVACGVGKGFALSIAFLHRNIQSLPKCHFKERYQNSKHLGRVFFMIWIIVETITVSPLFLINGDQDAIKNVFSSYDPVIKYIYSRESSTVCYVVDLKTSIAYGIIGVSATVVILLIPPIMLNMLYWIMNSKKTTSQSTFRIQWMLFISVCSQVLCAFVFLIIPMYITIFVDLFYIPNASTIICIAICISSLHSSIDCLTLIICITPYRRFVFNNLFKLVGLKDSNTLTPTTVIRTISGQSTRH